MTDPLLFLLATLTLLGAPGPTNTLLAAAGAAKGTMRSLPLLGAVLGAYAIAVTAILLIVGPAFAASPGVGIAMKVAVAIYLGWLALRMWRRTRVGGGAAAPGPTQVFVATLLNPKSLIFAIGVLPTSEELFWYLAAAAVAVPLTGLAWVALGHGVGLATSSDDRIVPRVASVALGGFAGFILASAFA